MEQQSDYSNDKQTTTRATPISPTPTVTTSVQSLRFPKPEGSQHLANWVSSSSPDIRKPGTMSEYGSLGDSAYEVINNVDWDSQDAISESVSSLECSRPADVRSLTGSSHEYNTDSDEGEEEQEDHHSSASSIRYASQVLQNPSTQLNSTNLQFRPTPDASVLPQSIEFLEADDDIDGEAYVDKISVKHTIREFDEEETATIAHCFAMEDTPKRLTAAIRQTMSHNCLSTQEPLRVMYTGSPVALKDIVYKLSSAIWASGSSDDGSNLKHPNGDAVYNIVPISSFGSPNAPEIELMESSGYQIRVEHCTAAEEMIVDEGSSPGEPAYCLAIDQNKSYKSFYSPDGFVVEPKWTLPHIAIFYSTENDDKQIERTQDVAWKFASRHGIPSIFICNNQSFDKPPGDRWRNFIDAHAVHMCLESRDLERPIPPRRLPIDLTSFLNIDARQMNRNLAYLTGLLEPIDRTRGEERLKLLPLMDSGTGGGDMKTYPEDLSQKDLWGVACEFAQNNMQWLVPLAMTCLGGILATAVALLMASSQAIQIYEPPVTPTLTSSFVPTVSTAVATHNPTTTVTVDTTSTTTVNIQHAGASVSHLASALSFAGFLSDKPLAAVPGPEAKDTPLSAEPHDHKDILIRIPADRKLTWLAKGAIGFTLHRGIESVRFSEVVIVDEGLVLKLDKRDAYSIINVTVVTKRKPKINKTFEVNFGKGHVVEAFEAGMEALGGVCEKVVHTLGNAAHTVNDTVTSVGDKIRIEAAAIAGHIEGAGQAAQRAADSAKNLLNPERLTKAVKDAQWHAANRVATRKEDAALTVLQAQIASKLWWLKVQGRKDEYADYEQKASDFLKEKHEAIVRAREKRFQDAWGKGFCGCGKHRTSRAGQPCSQMDCSQQAVKVGDRWRKILGG